MKINKIILKGYIRFKLNDIRFMEYTPNSTDQIVLGSNGAGKSSFLRELLEFANGKDFSKDGYKIVHVEHRGSKYVLTNKYPHQSGLHSFVKDGVELNDGSTGAVQKDLMKKHLGLSPLVVSIITGRKGYRFSEMGSELRKAALMEMSGTDFTLALQVFQKFKETTRDLKGAIATNDESMVAQQQELQQLEVVAKETESALDQMEAELQMLAIERVRDYLPPHEVEASLGRVCGSLTTLAMDTIREASQPTGLSVASKGALECNIEDFRRNLQVQQNEIQFIADEIDHLPKMESTGEAVDEDHLHARLMQIDQEINNAQLSLKGYVDIHTDANAHYASAQNLLEPLTTLMQGMPINEANGKFSKDGYRKLKEQYDWVVENTQSIRNQLAQQQAHLQHLTSVDEVDCPDCTARFRPGVNASVIAEKKEYIQKATTTLEERENSIKELTGALEEYKNYSDMVVRYRNLEGSYSQLKVFWDKVTYNEWMYKSPMSVVRELHHYMEDLKVQAEVVRLRGLRERVALQLEALTAAGGSRYLTERRAMLEQRLLLAEQAKHSTRESLSIHERVLQRVVSLEQRRERIIQLTQEFFRLRSQLHESIRQEAIAAVMNKHHSFIGAHRHTVNQYKVLMGTYEVLVKQREENVKKYECFKLLTQALSPNEGFVAENIKRFITYFTDLMNDHVSRVWNYDMEMRALPEMDTTLNWKFPVSIKSTNQEIPDVGLGSSGQVSMMDFAFKLVFMESKGLLDYPLLVDEFGKDFDMEHRERLVRYIKGLLTEGKFSQMFMVSHYASVYGSFNHAEYLVLDPRNITVPEKYNTQVVMQ